MNTPKTNLAKIQSLLRIPGGKPKPEETKKPSSTKVQEFGKTTWIDIQDPSELTVRQATEGYNLHALHLKQCLEKGQLAQINIEENYIYLILHFPYYLASENRISTSQVNIFLGKDYLITLHESADGSIRRVFEKYENQEMTEPKSSGRILYHIIEHLLQEVSALTQSISQELDEIEDNVFDTDESDAFQIGQLRQKVIRLRRTLAAQKNILGELDGAIDKFATEPLRRYYEKNTHTSQKLWETVEDAKEAIEIYKDVDFITTSERTNEILSILTIIFTLAIPATIIGTFMGMNVLLPGGIETGSWTFLGKYTTLIMVLVASALPALLMYWWFKKKKWM